MDRRQRNRRATDKDRSFSDRRSGERRKGLERRANVGSRDDYGTVRAYDVQPMFLRAEDFYAWYYDRRSGKDRRKG